jgi:hypothetical protein
MPKPILMLRVAVTLSCLVGVPAVALVGIRNAESNAPQRTVYAKQSAKLSMEDARAGVAADTTSQHYVDQRRKGDNGSGELTPGASIRDVTVDSSTAPEPNVVNTAGYDVPSTAAADPLAECLQRLQQFGVVYYRLESSPQAAAEFRFHCRVVGFEQPFEAVDPVAAKAVDRVLREVEAARQRLPPRYERPASAYAR